MNKKHPEGYWVQKLSDEQVWNLLYTLVSKKANRRFSKVLNYDRKDNIITINYCSHKTNCYLTYAEDSLIITDYKIGGRHPYMPYYEFMIDLFGDEYADDFLVYADEYIEKNPNEVWSSRLKKIKDAIPALLESYHHNLNNDI